MSGFEGQRNKDAFKKTEKFKERNKDIFCKSSNAHSTLNLFTIKAISHFFLVVFSLL